MCEVAPADQDRWLEAWERARTACLARAADRVRVRAAEPRLLGVHAAISVPGVPDHVPPQYVPRDVDAAEFGVRARVSAAARAGGFVLLVGGSSAGKTRCAVEAVKALLPEWWLVHPAGPDQVTALAQAPPPRTVVWLDELQRYLDGEDGLTGGVVRALLNGPHPVVIIGTLWPDRHHAYTAVPAPGGPDPRAREREVLDLAAVIRIDPEFSPAEQDRARAAAARDRRLAVALGAAGYGLTQTLAAAPQLVARWADARIGGPVRVGGADRGAGRGPARRPRPAARRPAAGGRAGLLHQRAAGRGAGQLVRAGPGLRHRQAARRRRRAGPRRRSRHGPGHRVHRGGLPAPARQPGTPPGPGARQHLGRPAQPPPRPRRRRPPRRQRPWPAAVPLRHPAVPPRRRRRRRARRLRLADLLAGRGDLDELRARADAGDGYAAMQLAGLLANRGDLDQLRARADADDRYAAERWPTTGRLRPGPRRHGPPPAGPLWPTPADAGSCAPAPTRREPPPATGRALADRGDVDGLRARADAGDGAAAMQLAELLAGRGDLDRPALLRARADAGDEHAAMRLAGLLADRGDLDQLRARADAGDEHAAWRLAALLADRGDLDQLRARADAGDRYAAMQLPELLARRGDLDQAEQLLRARADAGDEYAAMRLAALLVDRGDLDQLRARADAGDRYAAWRLADLLAECGDLDELRARTAATQLVALLAERGDLDQLRALADAGDGYAAWHLAGLLGKRGDLDGLRARADAGDRDAAGWLAGLLAERGDLDGLRALADAGDSDAAVTLAVQLGERGDLDELRALADAGDEHAAMRLAMAAGRARGSGSGRAAPARPGRRRRRGRRAAGRAAGAAGPGRGSGAVAPVRFEPGRVDCLCLKTL